MEWQKFKEGVRGFFSYPTETETIKIAVPKRDERELAHLRERRTRLAEEIHDRGYGVGYAVVPPAGIPQALSITVEGKKPATTLLRIGRRGLVVTTMHSPTKNIARLRFHEEGYDECDDDVSNYMVIDVFEKGRLKEMEMLAGFLEKKYGFTIEVMPGNDEPDFSLLRYWPELGNPLAKEPASYREFMLLVTPEARATYSRA